MEDLSAFNKGAGGEIQITDTLANLIGTLPLHGYKFQGRRYDCGNRVGFLRPISLLRCRRAVRGQSDLGENLRAVLRDIMDADFSPNLMTFLQNSGIQFV